MTGPYCPVCGCYVAECAGQVDELIECLAMWHRRPLRVLARFKRRGR